MKVKNGVLNQANILIYRGILNSKLSSLNLYVFIRIIRNMEGLLCGEDAKRNYQDFKKARLYEKVSKRIPAKNV